jgi:hypothetical protein
MQAKTHSLIFSVRRLTISQESLIFFRRQVQTNYGHHYLLVRTYIFL